MKKDIHPAYHDKVKVTCSCGSNFVVGSTMKALAVEVCSQCHPFYTGKQKLVDAAGRIDKFNKRKQEAEKAQHSKVVHKKPRKSVRRDSNTISL
jgi:large subunit ribosomal protein L31